MKDMKELLSLYVNGGQVEIQGMDHAVRRGQIQTISLTETEIRVQFQWLAKLVGKRWINQTDLSWSASLVGCEVSAIGEGRLFLDLSLIGTIATFFPASGSHLDPKRVEGLVL